jgi:hypothetical protein
MWAWEGGVNEQYYEPLVYCRTGPGLALDGKPKFDLTKFNQDYFDRLRAKVIAAGSRGIYVSIMLFQGWSIYNHDNGNPWPLHPYNKDNNINGINGDTNGDGEGKEVHTLQAPAITPIQEAYIRKVIDTVNDLDNVLYEITNETAIFSKDWQYCMVKFIKSYEAKKSRQHPVGMTAFDSGRAGAMAALWASPADWISPQNDGVAGDYTSDPPAADGRKVIISDTDHLWGVGGGRDSVWKSFTRGLNPIYMDPLTKPDGSVEALWKEARKAMGLTLSLAQRINLVMMPPHNELSSSQFCLANPGREYLVYLADGGEVTIDLTAASSKLAVEWMHPTEGTILPGEPISGGARRSFQSPFGSDAVLHLKTHKPKEEN